MVYLNFVCFGVKLSCILKSFRPMNSRMQTFECVGLLILHDLDLSSNETLCRLLFSHTYTVLNG